MKLGIALSGGGIRGIAEAGVLQALEENNIKPDIIGGTSCGSMIAVMYAMGYSPDNIYKLFKKYAKDIVKINKIPILSGLQSYIFRKKATIKGFNNGEKIEELYDKVSNQIGIYNINQIKMPIVIPAVDLITGKECVFTNHIPNSNLNKKEYINDISIGKAIRASSSFPVFYTPFKHEDYMFMDGGALNNTPADEVRFQGADCVISVKFRSDEIEPDSDIMDIVMKSIDIMGSKISETNLELSDFVLEVYTDKVGLLDIKKMDKCYYYGYNSVINNLDKIKKFIKKDY